MENNVFDFKSKNSDLQTKRVNKKKIFFVILVSVILLSIVGLYSLYTFNEKFRGFWDYTVLRKEVVSTDVESIYMEKDNLKYPYVYDKKIIVLEKNNLLAYDQDGKRSLELAINITEPLYSSDNRFLVIAENNGNKIYLLNENNIAWQKDLEGEISKVYVNKNGYVGVAISNSGYNKTEIILYTPSGVELFKTYLPTTYCIDLEISNDNKYMAIAEASTSGTMIETVIKIVSIENAKEKPQDAFIATYNSNAKNMILNLKYLDDGKLIAMYDDSVKYVNENMENIMDVNSNTLFIDIEGNNKIISIEKNQGGFLYKKYILKIYNISLNKTIEYDLKESPKDLYVKNDIIAINYGSDVEIISAVSGWLIKKYISKQEIKEIHILNNFVSVIYNDEIKIIKI